MASITSAFGAAGVASSGPRDHYNGSSMSGNTCSLRPLFVGGSGGSRPAARLRQTPPSLLCSSHAERRDRIDCTVPGPGGSRQVAAGSAPSHAPELDAPQRQSDSSASLAFQVREVAEAEYWNVAAVHTGSFYPAARHPMLFLFQLDRVLALHLGKVIEQNRQAVQGKYRCLVAAVSEMQYPRDQRLTSQALADQALADQVLPGMDEMLKRLVQRVTGLPNEQERSGHIVGAIVVDTLAQYIPKKLLGDKGSKVTKAYISNLAVSGSLRRQGIGEAVLKHAERLASDWGCDEIYLHVDPMNVAAYKLYLKAGYVAVDPSLIGNLKVPRQDAHLVLMTKPMALCL